MVNCNRCRTKMKLVGTIRAGPRKGLRKVYYCPKCGSRIIENKTK